MKKDEQRKTRVFMGRQLRMKPRFSKMNDGVVAVMISKKKILKFVNDLLLEN